LLLIAYGFHLYHYLAEGAFYTSDSFRYIWKTELSHHFLLASSLTVRTLNRLLGNDRDLIGHVQLIFAFVPPIALYLGLRTHSLKFNLFLIMVLFALYVSTGPIRYFNIVSSDSLFVSLLLTFTVVLFCSPHRYRWFLVLLVGIPFIFTRNAAPYIVLAQLALYLVLRFRDLRVKKMLISMFVLFSTCLTSLAIVECCDTTKEINAVDNLYTRIFPDPEKVEYFRTHYGMPVGPYIEICVAGTSSVNDPCVDHEAIYTGDAVTRQYRVTQDDYGFSDWVRQKGMKSWQHYILVANTANTLRQMNDAYGRYAENMFWENENKKIKSFVYLSRIYNAIGIFNDMVLGVYLMLGVTVYLYLGQDKILEMGMILILVSLPIFFVGFFGDAEELDRYTYPAVVCLYLGFLFYFIGMVRALTHKVLSSRRVGIGHR
jgi:hypothetical protein